MRSYINYLILYRLCGGGTGIEEEPCLVPCSIDCQMSDWNEWGVCNRLCGPGIHHRYRSVNNLKCLYNLILFFNNTILYQINRLNGTRQMEADHVVKRYKQKSVTLLVTVSNGLQTHGANVNYRKKTY